MKSKKSFFRTVEPYLYLIPVMILFILFVFWPFVKTIQLSFARTTPLGQVAQYVGRENVYPMNIRSTGAVHVE